MIAITDFTVQETEFHRADIEYKNLLNGSVTMNQTHTVLAGCDKEIVRSNIIKLLKGQTFQIRFLAYICFLGIDKE